MSARSSSASCAGSSRRTPGAASVADPVDRANEVKVAFAEARAALLEERLRRFPG